MHRPKKRSITLDGHRTSVSIEEEFWHQFVLIAQKQEKSINMLATEIDHIRGLDVGLASAIRLFILSHALGHTFP